MGFDPLVPSRDLEAAGIDWRSIEDGFSQVDAVLFMNNHREFSKLDVYKLIKKGALSSIKVNGEKVDEVALKDGDVIEIGNQKMTFRAGRAEG